MPATSTGRSPVQVEMTRATSVARIAQSGPRASCLGFVLSGPISTTRVCSVARMATDRAGHCSTGRRPTSASRTASADGQSESLTITSAPSAAGTCEPASALPTAKIAASVADRTSGKLRTRSGGMVNAARRASVSPRRRNVHQESDGDIPASPRARQRRRPGGCGPGLGPTARVPSVPAL